MILLLSMVSQTKEHELLGPIMKELSAIKSANQMAWENAVLCVHATLQAWAWGIAETAAKKKKKKEKKERKKN